MDTKTWAIFCFSILLLSGVGSGFLFSSIRIKFTLHWYWECSLWTWWSQRFLQPKQLWNFRGSTVFILDVPFPNYVRCSSWVSSLLRSSSIWLLNKLPLGLSSVLQERWVWVQPQEQLRIKVRKSGTILSWLTMQFLFSHFPDDEFCSTQHAGCPLRRWHVSEMPTGEPNGEAELCWHLRTKGSAGLMWL